MVCWIFYTNDYTCCQLLTCLSLLILLNSWWQLAPTAKERLKSGTSSTGHRHQSVDRQHSRRPGEQSSRWANLFHRVGKWAAGGDKWIFISIGSWWIWIFWMDWNHPSGGILGCVYQISITFSDSTTFCCLDLYEFIFRLLSAIAISGEGPGLLILRFVDAMQKLSMRLHIVYE